jgi:hypothetical protein
MEVGLKIDEFEKGRASEPEKSFLVVLALLFEIVPVDGNVDDGAYVCDEEDK